MKQLTAWTLAVALLATCAQSQAQPRTAGPTVDIWTAAATGNIEAMKRQLSAAANVKTEGESGVTPLFLAAVFGRVDAAKLLIERGADVKIANGEDGATALHVAAFFCHTETVELLLNRGADINARNQKSETPLDAVAGPWSEGLSELYVALAKAIGMELDLKRIEATRPKIAALLRKHGGATGRKPEETPPAPKQPTRTHKKPALTGEQVAALRLRGSYAVNGQIHVGTFGTPEGKPLTTGHQDMKPSWSKTGDMLVFFRLVTPAPRIPDWKTAICIVKTDGTGFRRLTDGTHTDFNPTWTRDGTNLVVLNRQNRETRGYVVMFASHDGRPGDEYAVSDTRIHTYAYSCLKDGRLLVSASGRPGYFLMTPGRNNRAKYEPLQCELARQGRLDRVSISPGETKVCFELQRGFGEYRYPGRILYIADFNAMARTITNPKVIANEAADRDATFLYPRWTRDESAVVYHHGRGGRNQLYMYRLADESMTRVSTNPGANYMFPHGEESPK